MLSARNFGSLAYFSDPMSDPRSSKKLELHNIKGSALNAPLGDGQLGHERVRNIANYVVPGKLWKAFTAETRPIVIITSNNEKELPDAFLRRCFFHYIRFPDRDTMEQIVGVHFPGIKKRLLKEALEVFYSLRDVNGLKKKPSTSEFLDWIRLLLADDIPPEALRMDANKAIPKLYGALLKNEQDVHMFERLAFLSRRAGQ